MTFTPFDPALSDDVSWVRLKIGDTVLNQGPRPLDMGRNFQDETIQAILNEQGHKNACVASLYETLAGEWARFNSSTEQDGGVKGDFKQLPDFYLNLATEWRKKPGGAGTDRSFEYGVIPVERMDAWSE